MDIYNRAETVAERKMVFSALGYAEAKNLKLRTLEWAVAEVLLQDFFYPMSGVVGSGKAGMEIAWRFFQDNFERIIKKLAKSSPSLTDAVVVTCSGGFSDAARIADVEAFYQAHPLPNNQRKITQMLESMKINNRFLASMSDSPLVTPEFWTEIQAKCS
ncbi:unnamed protein product [Phaeothamnion confervicola]